MALELMSAKYNQNHLQLHNMMNIPETMLPMLNMHNYVYKNTDIDNARRLVKEQIKINNMIKVGKSMLQDE
jgi:glycerol kinase